REVEDDKKPTSGTKDDRPEGQKVVEIIEQLNQGLDGLRKAWDAIPVPPPYRGVLASWGSFESVLLVIVSNVFGFKAGIGSMWFLAPTGVLTAVHGFTLLRAMRAKPRPGAHQVASASTCSHPGCTSTATLLAFCASHAQRARSVYRFLESFGEADAQ